MAFKTKLQRLDVTSLFVDFSPPLRRMLGFVVEEEYIFRDSETTSQGKVVIGDINSQESEIDILLIRGFGVISPLDIDHVSSVGMT